MTTSSFTEPSHEVCSVSITRPWRNKYFACCAMYTNVKVGATTSNVVDVIKFMLPIPDPRIQRDSENAMKVVARIADSRNGITVKMPSMATSMSHGATQIAGQETDDDGTKFDNDSGLTNHLASAAHFHNHPEVQNKEITFVFNHGIHVNNSHFNGVDDEDEPTLELITHTRFVAMQSEQTDEEDLKVPFMGPYLFWLLVVEKKKKTTKKKTKQKSESAGDAYSRMSGLSLI